MPSIQCSRETGPPPPTLVLHTDVPVGLRREATDLVANRALVREAAGTAAALQCVEVLFRLVGPREEENDVAGSAPGAGTKSADEVTAFEILPGNWLGNRREADGVVARGLRVESHGDEARAVRAVFAARGVGVRLAHRIGDALRSPVFAASNNLVTADLALVLGLALAAATTTAAATTAAFLGDHLGRAGPDVDVGDIASVSCLVPDVVTVDALAGRLARKLDIGALPVGFDNLVTGSGAGAAVDAVASDRICGDHGDSRSQGQDQACKVHDGGDVSAVDFGV